MSDSEQLAKLDQRFVDIYEAARARVVERQKEIALIVIQDDDLLFYRTGHKLERFPGLMPPLYNKTLGHMPLGAFCLLHEHTNAKLSQEVLEEVAAYRDAIKAAAGALDTEDDAKASALPAPARSMRSSRRSSMASSTRAAYRTMSSPSSPDRSPPISRQCSLPRRTRRSTLATRS